MLTNIELTACQQPVLLPTDHYYGRGGRQCAFRLAIDVVPLAVLAQSAALGQRVYELMSIQRPGDVLHYFRIHLVDVDEEIQKRVNKACCVFGQCDTDIKSLPFTKFDKLFFWEYDDTMNADQYWLDFRDHVFWKQITRQWLECVVQWQERLRQADDYLIQHELRLMSKCMHAADFTGNIERMFETEVSFNEQTNLPAELYAKINELIQRDTVQSVSCDLADYPLWRRLVTEQVQRAQRIKREPLAAFGLYGPDSRFVNIKIKEWGGDVFIPCQGALDADLFIKPHWYRFDPHAANEAGFLKLGANRRCHYLLMGEDYGELSCAHRMQVGDWFLYESKAPYVPNIHFN